MLFALGFGALTALPTFAQQPARARRIGYIANSGAQRSVPWLAAFRAGMAELRWVDGRDYVIDARYADGVAQRQRGLAGELVAAQPDLLLTGAEQGVRSFLEWTKTIPIVFAQASDPVGNGIAASLRRPGGTATGLTVLSRELGAKRLELLKDAFPRVVQVAVLFDPAFPGSLADVKVIEEAAPRLGMRVTSIGVQKGNIEGAFKRGAAAGAHAYMLTQSGLFAPQQVIEGSSRSGVPAIYMNSAFVESGGLMSYSPSNPDNFRRAAAYVDKIFKGAKPGDLPIEQPTKFELVVNMKTAKAMGFTIPQTILLRADRVIE